MSIEKSIDLPEKTIDEIIIENSEIYGTKVTQNHLPSSVDGLKSIHRRILYTAFGLERSKESLGMVSSVKENHSAGDISIYESIIRMSQSFINKPPLMSVTEGGGGEYCNPLPASARYTKMGISEFSLDVFFKHTSLESLPARRHPELLSKMEPIYLIPIIPTALLLNQNAIGYGFNNKLAPRNLTDVCNLTISYLNYIKDKKDKYKFPIRDHVEKLLPDSPIFNNLLNKDELLKNYKEGKYDAPIHVSGNVVLEKNKIIIYTLPYERSFDISSKIKQNMIKYRNKQSNREIDALLYNSIVDIFDEPDNVTINLKITLNVFEIYESIKSELGIFDRIQPNSNFVDEQGYIHNLNPLTLLHIWHDKIYNLRVSDKRSLMQRYYHELRILETLLIISGHTDRVISIIRHNDIETAILILMTEFKLSLFQSNYLVKASLSNISKTSKKDIEEKHKAQLKKIEDLKASFSYINEELIGKIKQLRNKYISSRSAISPEYIGAIYINDGYVQIKSLDEIEIIKLQMKKSIDHVIAYNNPNQYIVSNTLTSQQSLKKLNDKYTTSTIIDTPNLLDTYTVKLDTKTGKGGYKRGYLKDKENSGFIYTTKKSHILLDNGQLIHDNIGKHLKSQVKLSAYHLTNVLYIFPYKNYDTYLIYMTSEIKNKIKIYRINKDISKLNLPLLGDKFITHTSNKNTLLTLPKKFITKPSYKNISIFDIDSILNEKDEISFSLNKRHSFIEYL